MPSAYVQGTFTHAGTVPNDTWTLKRDKTETMVFDTFGRLTSITDLNGEQATLAYTSGSTTVTDSSGRSMVLTFNGAGTLASVTDPIGRVTTFVVNVDGDLGSMTDPQGQTTSFAYTGHLLTSMTDPRGGVTKNAYDALGRVTDQWDPVNSSSSANPHTHFAYDTPAVGSTTITDPEGNVEVQSYGDNGLIASDTRGAGTADAGTWSYQYDPVTSGMTLVTDPNGHHVTNTWDPSGRLSSTKNDLDPPTTYTYDSTSGLVLSVTDPQGVTTTYTRLDHVHATAVSSPLLVDVNNPTGATQTTSFTYGDPSHPGDVTAVVDPRGKSTSIHYDAYGNRDSVTDPVGNKATTGFDRVSRPVWTVSPRGNTAGGDPNLYRSVTGTDLVSRGYISMAPNAVPMVDDFGRAPTTTELGATDTGQTWTARSGVWGVGGGAFAVSGSPALASFPASSNGAVLFNEAVPQAGMGVAFRLSDASHYWKVTANPAGNNWVLAKIGGSSVAAVATPAGSCCDRGTSVAVAYTGTTIYVVVNTPGGASNVIAATDTEYVKNTGVGVVADGSGPGRISSLAVETSLGSTAWSGFDGNGNTVWSNDGNGNHTTVAYDADDRPVTTTRADGSIQRQTWNNNSQQTAFKDARYQSSPNPADWSTYGYDHQGRLASEKPVGMGTTTHTYTYNTAGEVQVTATPDGGTSTLTLDAADRPHQVVYTGATGTAPTPTVTFGYDHDGRRTSMTTGTASSAWQYDSLGRLNVSTRDGRSVGYRYDLTNNLTQLVYPGNVAVSRTFDDASRLTKVTDWLSGSPGTSFGYDADSDLTTSSFPNGVVTTRSPDSLGRTVSITVKKGATTLASFTQSFDNQSNITAVTATGVGANQTYGYNQLNQLNANSPQTLGYDLADNITSITNTTKQDFTSSHQPCFTTSAFTTSGDLTKTCTSNPPPGWSYTYSYDARGNRTATNFPFATPKNANYDQADRLTGYTQGSTTNATYTYDGDNLRTHKSVNATTTNYTWDEAGGLPLLLQDGSDDYIYGPLGEPIERINATGATYIHQDHLGSTRLLTDTTGTNVGTYTYTPYGATSSHTGSATVNLQYAGQYTDPETGYQYLRNRYYDPITAQFISVDPAVEATQSPYGYVEENPLIGVDPSGLFCVKTCSDPFDGMRAGAASPIYTDDGRWTYSGTTRADSTATVHYQGHFLPEGGDLPVQFDRDLLFGFVHGDLAPNTSIFTRESSAYYVLTNGFQINATTVWVRAMVRLCGLFGCYSRQIDAKYLEDYDVTFGFAPSSISHRAFKRRLRRDYPGLYC